MRETVPLHSGARMPVLGLGTWELTHDTRDTVLRALELGYRMLDTACDYGSEAGIRAALNETSVPRPELYVVDKVEEDESPIDATRRRLDDLGLEQLDLVLLHRPPRDGSNGERLWSGLLRARADGLARDVGVSNYAADQLQALQQSSGEWPAVNQIEWSPFGHSDSMLEFCRAHGIVLQAYSPLTRSHRLEEPALVEIAHRHARSPAQVLLRWSLQRGSVPLPKANDPGHLEENLGALDFTLPDEDMVALTRLNEHWSALGELPYVRH